MVVYRCKGYSARWPGGERRESMHDSEIVDLVFRRSEAAIEAVEKKYGALCYGVAWNLLHSQEDAAECVNDTWHGLWNAIPPQKPEKLGPYAARITRNLAMKRLAHRNAGKRQAVTVSYEELNQCIPDGKTVEAALEGKELSRLLDAFLDTLGSQDRNLFLRRYWFFDSVRQLSRSFGMTESHVKVKLYRMRKALKHYLEQEADIYVG